MQTISFEDLKVFIPEVLKKAGLDDFSNKAVADSLIETSMRGVDSHGIRLLPHYVRSALSGRKNPKPNFKFYQKFPAIGLLDADDAFGHSAGMKAIDHCLEMAEKLGMGAVSVKNSSHPGAMGSFALKAARKGYIAFAFTHADSLLLSYNGTKPYFGTNPICCAVPRLGMEPFCLDMSSTHTSWNTVLLKRSKGELLDEPIAADGNGNPTNDPQKAQCLLPIGGYKGYGIAAMVEILCSMVSGMEFGTQIPSMFKAPIEKNRKLGQFYLIFKADIGTDYKEFITRMTQMTEQVHASEAKPGQQVILPGDKEIKIFAERMKVGIPLDQATADEFTKLANDFNLKVNIKK